MLEPGGTIGILGGGQLGRMTAMAARTMGYRVVVFEPTPHSPAGQVADRQITASYDDPQAVADFADAVDVVTLEFENLPAAVVDQLAERVPTRPKAAALRVCQDRLAERAFLRRIGVPTGQYAPILDHESIVAACTEIAFPALLKTATLGYDSKGQRRVETAIELPAAHAALGGVPSILEELLLFEREISVVAARDILGNTATYEPAENVHVHGILDTSSVPAAIATERATTARELTAAIAEALDLVGVMAVEFFLMPDGTLLVNEMAPRPHNSGHWSIEACKTSQFEQQVRAAVGAPLGPTDLLAPAATANLLGDLWQKGTPRWNQVLAMPDVKLHLYGKEGARPGRKMGHLTALGATAEAARERVGEARARLPAV